MLRYQQDACQGMACGLSVLNTKMICSDLEMQIKMFLAIRSVEARVSTGKISSTSCAD